MSDTPVVPTPDLGPLLQRLVATTCLDDAAGFVLGEMLDVLDDGLDLDPAWSDAIPLRGVLHLRQTGEYKALISREYAGIGGGEISPSATAWRWMAQERAPGLLDVAEGQMHPLGDAPRLTQRQLRTLGNKTLQLMADRSASHALLLPLRGAGGVLHGTVSLELRCQYSTSRALAFAQAAAPALTALADLASPTLAALPAPAPSIDEVDPLLPVVGERMAALLRLLRVFVQQDETLLISGPTGAGKSRLAAWCHARSPRADGPLVTVQLSTLPEDMQLPTLFGWRKGAFTGAVRSQDGEIARAGGGTLFLDEIGKLSLKAQTGLLRLLESKRYRPMGAAGGERTADVRFVIGTNQDLARAVAEGRFLEDLYYRIHVLPLAVPSLAERRDELPGWVRFMLQRRHEEAGLEGVVELEPAALAALEGRSWPGNLRQLDNVIRRAYAIALAHGAEPTQLRVAAAHVSQALGFETSGPDQVAAPRGLWEALQRAAQAWAARGLDLDHVDAFRGLVLHAARVDAGGDLADAYRVVAKDSVVASRNHQRDFRRQLAKVEALMTALGAAPDADLERSLRA